jgi:hypothetical protein
LERNGFYVVGFTNLEKYVPVKGDVVIFGPYPGGNSSGHIQAFDGRGCVSDFTQGRFWPGSGYEREEAVYVVYRRWKNVRTRSDLVRIDMESSISRCTKREDCTRCSDVS